MRSDRRDYWSESRIFCIYKLECGRIAETIGQKAESIVFYEVEGGRLAENGSGRKLNGTFGHPRTRDGADKFLFR